MGDSGVSLQCTILGDDRLNRLVLVFQHTWGDEINFVGREKFWINMDIRRHTNYCGYGHVNVGIVCASAWSQVSFLQLAPLTHDSTHVGVKLWKGIDQSRKGQQDDLGKAMSIQMLNAVMHAHPFPFIRLNFLLILRLYVFHKFNEVDYCAVGGYLWQERYVSIMLSTDHSR